MSLNPRQFTEQEKAMRARYGFGTDERKPYENPLNVEYSRTGWVTYDPSAGSNMVGYKWESPQDDGPDGGVPATV